MVPKWVAVQKARRICAIVTIPGKPGSKRMETYTQVPQRVFVDLEELSGTSPMDRKRDADVARSEENILRWMAYLPEDCIRTMIQMGWDVTT